MPEDNKIILKGKQWSHRKWDRRRNTHQIKLYEAVQKFGSESPAKAFVIKPHQTLLKGRIETALRWAEALVRDMHDKNLIYDISLL